MNKYELANEYGKTGLWLHDIPVHSPNGYCSRCAKRLGTMNPISFEIQRNDKMTLKFEYHKECVIKALNELRDQQSPNETLLKTG